MDVGRALIDGVEHDLLQIAHHRRIVDFDAAGILLGSSGAFLVGEIEIEIFRIQHRHRVVVCLTRLLDQFAELVVLHHHRFHRLAGLELHFVQRLQMGRVGGRHVQLVAALIQRNHAPFLHQLGIEQPLRQVLGIHGVQVQIGKAERDRGEFGDLVSLETLALDELGHERIARLAGALPYALGIVLGQPAMVDHGARQSG